MAVLRLDQEFAGMYPGKVFCRERSSDFHTPQEFGYSSPNHNRLSDEQICVYKLPKMGVGGGIRVSQPLGKETWMAGWMNAETDEWMSEYLGGLMAGEGNGGGWGRGVWVHSLPCELSPLCMDTCCRLSPCSCLVAMVSVRPPSCPV